MTQKIQLSPDQLLRVFRRADAAVVNDQFSSPVAVALAPDVYGDMDKPRIVLSSGEEDFHYEVDPEKADASATKTVNGWEIAMNGTDACGNEVRVYAIPLGPLDPPSVLEETK